ncbi:MAG: orotate phosphoribosyltransferase, partial [Bacteroidetes bacterium]|nr:orotate phosphoribosyltransferase [Bacteroidota bacterium]
GLDVIGMVSIFTYGFPVAKEVFEKADVPYKSLTNYQSLISLAIEKNIVTEEQKDILLKWREDPANWKGIL